MSESYVKCKACNKVFDSAKLILDEDKDMDFCPYCGEGDSVVAVSEQVLIEGDYSFVADNVFFTSPYIIDKETPKCFYSGDIRFLKSKIGTAELMSIREFPYIKVIAHSEDEIRDIINEWFKKKASKIKSEKLSAKEPSFSEKIADYLTSCSDEEFFNVFELFAKKAGKDIGELEGFTDWLNSTLKEIHLSWLEKEALSYETS